MIPVGLAVATVAMVLLAVVSRDPQPSVAALVSVFCLNGLGMGYAFSPVMYVGLSEVPTRDIANASGLLTTVLQLAQAVGIATFGTLFLSLFAVLPVPQAEVGTAIALAAVEVPTAIVAWLYLGRRSRPARLSS